MENSIRAGEAHALRPRKRTDNRLGKEGWLKYGMAMNGHDRILIDPAICHGKPLIRGTRMPVSLVVGSLGGGMTFEQLRQEYDLATEDILAALKFVGPLADQESHHLLPA